MKMCANDIAIHWQEGVSFFRTQYNRVLSLWEQLEFVNLWYVLICANDVLIVIGVLLKLGLESRVCNDVLIEQGM